MTSISTTIYNRDRTLGETERSIFHYGAVACGAILILVIYAPIFAAALLTLSLVEVRQANMVNFNAMIAALDQRDRERDGETGLAAVLYRLRQERKEYNDLIAHSRDCFSVVGTILADEQYNQGGNPSAGNQNSDSKPRRTQPRSCDEIDNTIKNHANELRITEDREIFKLANVDAYYFGYIDGITQKMPQIIPVLRFLDSGHPWINSWTRSSFELMEMFLLVSMGMLGGIINATRWLVDRSSPNSSLLEYLYKPAVGGVIALGVFVVFRASQLILGGQAQDGAVVVTASIYLLAGLGLVSGFCADNAVRQIEKAADRLFHSGTPSGSSKAADPIDHQQVPAH
jgi:hypothetical protein